MDLKYFLSILWKRAWLLVLAPLVAGTISLLVSQQMQPVYRATATLLVSPAGGSASLNFNTLLTAERVAKTYAELLTKRPLLEEVINDLQLNLTPRQLAGKIDVVQPNDTQLLELRVDDNDPEMANDIANSIANTFLHQHKRRRSDRSVYVEIVELAVLPTYKLRPRIFFNTLVAAVGAAILTLGFVFLLDHVDDTLTDPESVEAALQIATLATTPLVHKHTFLRRNSKTQVPVTAIQPMSPFAEAHRMLRTNVQFANNNQEVATLLISSAVPKEGKTTTVANLGVVMAQAGMKVLLVDADLRQPSLHKMFNLSNQVGLADLLQTNEALETSYLLETTVRNLRLLPGGSLTGDPGLTPSEFLGSARMTEIIADLRELTDILLIDSPPVLAVTDAPVLASRVDGLLLVIASGRTPKETVKKAVNNLRSVKANLLGAILTQSKIGVSDHYYGYYGAKLDKLVRNDTPLVISLPTSKPAHSKSLDSDNGNK